MCDLDSSAYETGFPIIDELSSFDNSQSCYNLSDLLFPGINFTNDGTEENMEYPTLEETIGAADFTFGGSSIGFQQTSDSSWVNHLMCHQAIPFTEELSVISSEISSDRVDYWDQETFIKGVLELADDANSLPALLIDETSKRKKVTLALDLDGNFLSSMLTRMDTDLFNGKLFWDYIMNNVLHYQKNVKIAFSYGAMFYIYFISTAVISIKDEPTPKLLLAVYFVAYILSSNI